MEYALSVVVPVYNAEKTIRRCAESVVLGRLRNVQLILVDDCSTDHSWDICSQLAQEFSNITCIRNENNRGVSATRNRALSAVRGEYVLFVDSDDWVSAHYAEALWHCAKTVPADALVLCAYHYLDHVNHTRSTVLADGELHQTTFVPMADACALLEKTFLQQLWNKIFRRDVIEAHQLRFDERMRMGGDFQFVLDYMTAIQCKKCVVLNEPLYYYGEPRKFTIVNHVNNKTVTEGLSFGAALAMVISYVEWKSIGWAILHGLLGWVYVIYYAIKYIL